MTPNTSFSMTLPNISANTVRVRRRRRVAQDVSMPQGIAAGVATMIGALDGGRQRVTEIHLDMTTLVYGEFAAPDERVLHEGLSAEEFDVYTDQVVTLEMLAEFHRAAQPKSDQEYVELDLPYIP